ncbi:MAG: hypothetical protein HPY76_09430 [Anaerolineae bacterium]|jgi:hypothetical protein|nr:hypothetical protein [Anaerolineae bacterium]
MWDLKPYFLLDADITFLNHGSFGATPFPVMQAYQDGQRRLERLNRLNGTGRSSYAFPYRGTIRKPTWTHCWRRSRNCSHT